MKRSYYVSKTSKHPQRFPLIDVSEILLCTVLPLVLPFVFEIPVDIFTTKGQWILFLLGLGVTIGALLFFQKRRSKIRYSSLKDQVARRTFSNAYSLMEKKKESLANRAYDTDYTIPHRWIPYNVHSYIGEVCNEFRNTIAEITGIDREQVSVSFIYRYTYPQADNEDKNGAGLWVKNLLPAGTLKIM